MTNVVVASPTKRFFVSMLTRDIELRDAIMDLLDNCIDGVLRQLSEERESDKPYHGSWARIDATPQQFSIRDNCGGISRDIALNSAFRLGRLDTDRDEDIPTVGMYGIGMKRALFKMGRDSTVTSRHEGNSYYVEIKPEWLEDDADWNLELHDIPNELEADGTHIRVGQLYEGIAKQFDQESSNFLVDLTAPFQNWW